jgi:hypothetical protein
MATSTAPPLLDMNCHVTSITSTKKGFTDYEYHCGGHDAEISRLSSISVESPVFVVPSMAAFIICTGVGLCAGFGAETIHTQG